MGKVNGSTLFVIVGEQIIAKSKAYQLSVEMQKLDSVSNANGMFTDHISKIGSWSLSSDALTIYDGYSYGDLYDIFKNRQRVWLSIGAETDYTLLGLAMVESLTNSAAMENVASYSVNFKGVGELYQSTLPAERFIIDELFEKIIDQDSNYLIYT
jgi:predicted secreted protein